MSNKKTMIVVTIILCMVILDQVTKVLVENHFVNKVITKNAEGLKSEVRFRKNPTIEIIPGYFNIQYVENPGITFGMMRSWNTVYRRPILIAVPLIVLLVLLSIIRKTEEKEWVNYSAFAFIIGGAVGNIIDRLRLDYVIDFLDFAIGDYHWPSFNIADAAICVGMGLLLIEMFRGKEPFNVRKKIEEN